MKFKRGDIVQATNSDGTLNKLTWEFECYYDGQLPVYDCKLTCVEEPHHQGIYGISKDLWPIMGRHVLIETFDFPEFSG